MVGQFGGGEGGQCGGVSTAVRHSSDCRRPRLTLVSPREQVGGE
jgi:hypothetical protein